MNKTYTIFLVVAFTLMGIGWFVSNHTVGQNIFNLGVFVGVAAILIRFFKVTIKWLK